MKTTVEKAITITVSNDWNCISMEFENGVCVKFDSDLPYQKSINDWKFYIKAVSKVLKVLEREK